MILNKKLLKRASFFNDVCKSDVITEDTFKSEERINQHIEQKPGEHHLKSLVLIEHIFRTNPETSYGLSPSKQLPKINRYDIKRLLNSDGKIEPSKIRWVDTCFGSNKNSCGRASRLVDEGWGGELLCIEGVETADSSFQVHINKPYSVIIREQLLLDLEMDDYSWN